jgi:uncharacterized membrane protein
MKTTIPKLLSLVSFLFLFSCNSIEEILPSQSKIAAVEDGAPFYVYPNINNGTFTVQASNDSEQEYQLFVFDPQGKKIANQTIPRKDTKSIMIEAEQKGTYHATLQTPSSTFFRKILVI